MSNNLGQKLAGKIAVITGGSSGIGLATAKRFVQEGAHVVITGRREKELKEAVTLIGKNVTTVTGDVSRLEDLDRLYAVVKEKHGHIDVLFANAGAGTIAPLAVATEPHFDQTFDVNVKGMFFTVQKALPLFKDGGSIILNSSVSNVKGLAGFTAYAASKAAVRNFARGWTMELKDRNIRVNSMSPGAIDTPALATTTGLTAEQAEQAVAQFTSQIPMGRRASQRKSRLPSRSSPPMKVHISPVWISLSMEAWHRSNPGAVPCLALASHGTTFLKF
jgi:NAD(P)-dependent dehydrogenase (short-subunit alcohol dehydrogenase family)